jgi:hypothetical protein
MLLPAPPLVLRKPRKRFPVPKKPNVAPAAPLVLVSATYDRPASVDLTFDRAIDVSGIDPAALLVWDGEFGFEYQGDGEVELLSPTTVRVLLNGIAEWTGEGVTMSVGADNGIVASDDGGMWAGVTDLALPFP